MLTWKEYDSYVNELKTVRFEFTIVNSSYKYLTDYSSVEYLIKKISDLSEKISSSIISTNTTGFNHAIELNNICSLMEKWFHSELNEKIQLSKEIFSLFDSFFSGFRCYHAIQTLAVCAIVKNENKYIEEWIEYHRLYGVCKFFIYDNNSSDNLRKNLSHYINDGIVEYCYWPGNKAQLSAYTHCINNHKDDIGYIAFIDIDEFLTPVANESLPDTVEDILLLNIHSGAVGVNWITFGSSGHEVEPEGLVIENYTKRAQLNEDVNKNIKSIVNPRCSNGYSLNPHETSLIEGYHCISENGSTICGPYFFDPSYSKLRINHYTTKSKEYFFKKAKRGGAASGNYITTDEAINYKFTSAQQIFNSVDDYFAHKISDSLHSVISENHRNDTQTSSTIYNDVVSVILPVNIISDSVSYSINQILCQTYENIEIILVTNYQSVYEDLSTKFNNHNKVKNYSTDANCNLFEMYKFGLSKCNGKKIIFFYSFFFNSPERIETQYNYLSQNPSVQSVISLTGIMGEIGVDSILPFFANSFSEEFHDFYELITYSEIALSSIMFNKNYLQDIIFNEEKNINSFEDLLYAMISSNSVDILPSLHLSINEPVITNYFNSSNYYESTSKWIAHNKSILEYNGLLKSVLNSFFTLSEKHGHLDYAKNTFMKEMLSILS